MTKVDHTKEQLGHGDAEALALGEGSNFLDDGVTADPTAAAIPDPDPAPDPEEKPKSRSRAKK